MNYRKYVFSQLLDFLDRNHFNYLVRKYEGDKYVKQFTCYNQLAVLYHQRWQIELFFKWLKQQLNKKSSGEKQRMP